MHLPTSTYLQLLRNRLDLSSIPFMGSNDPFGGKRGQRRMTGWV